MSCLFDWENVCLVCLQKGENCFIFRADSDSNVIADKIMKCADILIKRNTNQPQNICLQCLEDLNIAYKFRRNCEQSDSLIKALLNTNRKEFQIKDLWKTTSFTACPPPDLCIKDEILDSIVIDESCDDLGDDPDAQENFFGEDCVDGSNKTEQKANNEIGKRPRGRPKKSTATACAKARLKTASKNTPGPCTKDEIVDYASVGDICKNSLCLDLENNPVPEAKFFEKSGDVCVHSKAMEINNMKDGESNRTKRAMDCEIARRPRGRPRKSAELNNVKANKSDKTNGEMNCEISRRPRGRPKKSTGVSRAKSSLQSASINKPRKICEICNHSFRNQRTLDDHIRRHNNDRNFSCDHCDKSFVTAPDLQRHMKLHTGQKRYKCQYCDRRFSDYGVRQNHESTHTGERPYKCSTCGKSFAAYSKGLIRHLQIHTNEKKFICKKCGKGFTQKVYFKKHVARHLVRVELARHLIREELNSSEHKQMKELEKEIFHVEESADCSEINIKHEVKLIEEELNDSTFRTCIDGLVSDKDEYLAG